MALVHGVVACGEASLKKAKEPAESVHHSTLNNAKVNSMSSKFLLRVFFLAGVFLAAYSCSAYAYETYTDPNTYTGPRTGTGNCANCHGGNFHTIPYVSVADGATWPDSLHGIHELMVDMDCSACHNSSGSYPTYLNSSSGNNGFNLSCIGCHGRPESASGGQVTGAGLRQHHWNSGVTSCDAVGCHSDSNPASFTAVGENVPPPYYFTPDSSHPTKPTDPCNPGVEENFAGTPIGLDNDGDGLYDMSDSNCLTTAPDINLNPAALNFGSLIIGNSNILNTQIENLGDADLVVTSVALGAGTNTEFSFSTPVTPFTVPVGASQNVSVTYQPINQGTDNGSLVISSNDPDESTLATALQGSGKTNRLIWLYMPAIHAKGVEQN